ncbi:MAG: hypothetical protein IJH78_03305, partial [Clostridia bacterium]|nr:hypothetical protein [Clostridia bacterium]
GIQNDPVAVGLLKVTCFEQEFPHKKTLLNTSRKGAQNTCAADSRRGREKHPAVKKRFLRATSNILPFRETEDFFIGR